MPVRTRQSLSQMDQELNNRGRAAFLGTLKADPIYPQLPVRGGVSLQDPDNNYAEIQSIPATPKRKTRKASRSPRVKKVDNVQNKTSTSDVVSTDDKPVKDGAMVLSRSGLALKVLRTLTGSPRSKKTNNIKSRDEHESYGSWVHSVLKSWAVSLIWIGIIVAILCVGYWVITTYVEVYEERITKLSEENEKALGFLREICDVERLKPYLSPDTAADCTVKRAFVKGCCEKRARKEALEHFGAAFEAKFFQYLTVIGVLVLIAIIAFAVCAHYSLTNSCRKRDHRDMMNAMIEASCDDDS